MRTIGHTLACFVVSSEHHAIRTGTGVALTVDETQMATVVSGLVSTLVVTCNMTTITY